MKTSIAAHWAALRQHFAYHAMVVDRFRHIDHEAVLRMWKSQTNEDGNRLSQFDPSSTVVARKLL